MNEVEMSELSWDTWDTGNETKRFTNADLLYIRCKCETSLLYFGHVVKQSVSHLPNLNIFLTVILYVKWVYQRKNAK